jgi:predicted deacylase
VVALVAPVPGAQIPLACLATTVELGGQADTGRAEARLHAEGILAFLAEQGLISGDWPAAHTSVRRHALRRH